MTTQDQIRSRIVGHGEEAPEQLLAHPQNFRRHPGEQLDALRGSLRQLGWVKTVLVNQRTGHVVDGHARVEEAMRQGQKTVPVTYLDLSEDDERLALAAIDPISEMATRDQAVLDQLLSEVVTDDPGLRAMLDEMKGGAPEPDGGPANEPQEQEVAGLIVDCASLAQRDMLAARLTAEGFSCRRTVLKRE